VHSTEQTGGASRSKAAVDGGVIRWLQWPLMLCWPEVMAGIVRSFSLSERAMIQDENGDAAGSRSFAAEQR